MFSQGIIEESQSPWNAQLLIVSKNDRNWRPITDYRCLNMVPVKDRFPLLVILDVLHSLGSNKVFSTLDLLSGSYPTDKESHPLTIFSTP